MSSPANDLAR